MNKLARNKIIKFYEFFGVLLLSYITKKKFVILSKYSEGGYDKKES
jgi:hypothetical protein